MNRRNDLENAEGFDEDTWTLMGMLSSEDTHNPKPMFISIVGESGAGKNTLAGIIRGMMMGTRIIVRYNMEPGSSMEDFLKEVYRRASLSLDGQREGGGSSSNDTGDKLRRLLARRRYLLILGGISSKITLNCLGASLPDFEDDYDYGQVMLILDTENEELGWHVNTMNRGGIDGVHMLTRLDRERSAQLFFWKVFRKGQYSSSSHGKESSNRREDYDKKQLADLTQKREEEEKQDSLEQKREEEKKQDSLKQKREEQQDEEERAAIKKERLDAAMEFHAKMKEREEKGKNEEELAVLRKTREEKQKKEEKDQAALKKKREEKQKEEEEDQAAVKKKREEMKKEQEQELAALKKKIEEKEKKEAADRDLHERLVHEITGGYPMAIMLLAGLLRFKEKPGQWNAVLEQLKPVNNGSAQDGGGEGLPNRQISSNQQGCSGAIRAIEIVFWASFEDLPNDLKSCFLYFVAYPRNFSHSADTIVRMWVAEGFISRQNGKTMEEVGYDYLKELVLRCLVEVEEMKVDGGIQLVRIHSSLMGFLLSEVRESGFMEVHDIHEAFVPSSVRRLCVQSDNGRLYAAMFAGKKFPKLRSFICHIKEGDQRHYYHDRDDGEGEREHHQDLKFLRWSKFLRVLSVQYPLAYELGDTMIHLRYLRIDCPGLYHLPSSIAGLLNLQTLDISKTDVQVIHQNFWKIKTLRHVLARNLTLPTVVVEEGELQTLHGVKPDNSSKSRAWSIGNCPLDKMKNLRSLEMHAIIHDIHGPALEAALRKMHLLGHLHLKGDQIPSSVFTTPSLRSLQTMKLQGYLEWDDIVRQLPVGDRPLRMVWPNLVRLEMNYLALGSMPESIQQQLQGILNY